MLIRMQILMPAARIPQIRVKERLLNRLPRNSLPMASSLLPDTTDRTDNG